MTILVDIDSTITNFSEALLNWLNANKVPDKHNQTHHEYSDIISYDWFEETYADPWYPTRTKLFWNTVKVNPEAVSILESWMKQGFNVYLVSASWIDDVLGHKIQTTLEAFNPELINERNVVITQDKSIIRGDVIIDDCVDNLYSFDKVRICYAQPWNENYPGAFRYSDWNKIDQVVHTYTCDPWYM